MVELTKKKFKNLISTAKKGGDGLFYRAEILTVAAEMVVVRYLDYGNQAFINSKEHVLTFPNELINIAAQAIKEGWKFFGNFFSNFFNPQKVLVTDE